VQFTAGKEIFSRKCRFGFRFKYEDATTIL